MFKAMAAANGKHEDDLDDVEVDAVEVDDRGHGLQRGVGGRDRGGRVGR